LCKLHFKTMKYPIEIEISDYCSLKCQCCPNKDFKVNWNISEENFHLALDYVYLNSEHISFLDLCWLWDIFLHPKIDNFLIYLAEKFKDREIKVLIPTKWISVNAKNINTLKKIKDIWLDYNISIWIYSVRKEVHDKITWFKGSFSKTFEFIQKLKDNDLPFSLEMMINSFSVNEIEYFQNICSSLWVNCKVHNYHNFSWSIKKDNLFKYNSKDNKIQCSFADKEDFDLDLYCKNPLPMISWDWKLFACTHWWKHKRYMIEDISSIFVKYPDYENLLNYIFKNKLSESLCKDCTYLVMP
jgi:hypothetical protein